MKRSVPLILASAALVASSSLAAPASARPVAIVVAATAVEVDVPKNDGWVTDLAGLLTADEERALEARMESYRQGSGHEMALLTVPDLGGESLERVGLETFRQWGLGSKESSDGALLLVSKGDKKIRIEVGKGLEGTLTDSISGRIIRDVITPSFRSGKFGEGLTAGIEAMHTAAGGDYSTLPPQRRGGRTTVAGHLARAVISIALFFFFLAMVSRSARRHGGRTGMGGLAGPLILGSMLGNAGRQRGGGFGGFGGGGGGGFGGFGGGGGFSGGGASGGW